MAEVKSAQADRFAEAPDSSKCLFLVYGPDQGLASERAQKICDRLGVNLDDPFSVIRMDGEVLASDSSRLLDETQTISMFSSKRLIRVSAPSQRNLAKAVKPILENPPADAWIVVEAGDLKRDSALRRMVERASCAIAIPCYPDGPRDLDRLISTHLGEAKLKIDSDTQALLREFLGGDRMATRNELEKLALYCQGRESVGVDDVRAIVGDTARLGMDDAVDAALSGDASGLRNHMIRLLEAGIAADRTLSAALRHFHLLHAARCEMEAKRRSASQAASSMRPPLHFSRRDAFASALSRWNAQSIARALERLDRAVLECRMNPAIAESIAGMALLGVAAQARSLRRR